MIPFTRRAVLTICGAGLLAIVCSPEPVVQPHSQLPRGSIEQRIRVILTPVRSSIYSGQPAEFRVEIWNEGTEDVLIGKYLDGPDNTLSRLELFIVQGIKRERSRYRSAGDYASGHKEIFASILITNWIALAPGHFYGQKVTMDSQGFPNLKIPGKHEIRGEYISDNPFSPGVNNPLAEFRSDMQVLPYRAWEGRIDTNSVWIEVKARKTK
jgi:hypothetical protein